MKRAPHIQMTEQQFRRRKRRQYNELMRQLKLLWRHSAYLDKEASLELIDARSRLENFGRLCRSWWRHA